MTVLSAEPCTHRQTHTRCVFRLTAECVCVLLQHAVHSCSQSDAHSSLTQSAFMSRDMIVIGRSGLIARFFPHISDEQNGIQCMLGVGRNDEVSSLLEVISINRLCICSV